VLTKGSLEVSIITAFFPPFSTICSREWLDVNQNLMASASLLAAAVTAAQTLFAALRDPTAPSAARAQRICELQGEFERHWAGVAAAAAELDAEEAELSGLLQERSLLSEVPSCPPRPCPRPTALPDTALLLRHRRSLSEVCWSRRKWTRCASCCATWP